MSINVDWRYRLLMKLLAPLLVCHALWQAIRAGSARLAWQRLSLHLPGRTDRPIWIHAASVGEVNAAIPLVDELRRCHPGMPIVVSTITASGAATARQKLPEDVEHIYLPIDTHLFARRLLRALNPCMALIMETEIWPQHYSACATQGIPLIIVNGRLSPRTLDRPAWIRAIYQRALQNVTQVLARSAEDAQRYSGLGMAGQRISVIDNIKYAYSPSEDDLMTPVELDRPYVVAASTHEDEELQLAQMWRQAGLGNKHLLVIVPRHPIRGQEIARQLKSVGIDAVLRSSGQAIEAGVSIYIADTFGELVRFIAGAELVFVGGSLIPRGGQNVIEAARAGKVAIFGPHMENFAEESRLLLEYQAAFQITNTDELAALLKRLLNSTDERHAIGHKAGQLVESRADVAQRYVAALSGFFQ